MNVTDRAGPMRDAAIWSRVTKVMDEAVRQQTIVGAVVCIALNGEKVLERAVGYCDRARAVAMTCDTIFRLSSLTKPIVATAAMALIERKTTCVPEVLQ